MHCDTTYSDVTAFDGRGLAAAAVEVEGIMAVEAIKNGNEQCDAAALTSSQLHVRGSLTSGLEYSFTTAAMTSPPRSLFAGTTCVQSSGDALVGLQMTNGAWVKACLPDGR